MKYSMILKKGIQNSNLSLAQIAIRLKSYGVRVDKSYLSKLQNGKKPPATDAINEALSKVLDIEAVDLKLAAYRNKIPKDILQELEKNILTYELRDKGGTLHG